MNSNFLRRRLDRFLLITLLLAGLNGCAPEDGIGVASGQRIDTASRPNILFVHTDDQSWEHLGAYGDLAVSTPNIDRLADEGVIFEHAYTAAPSCSPSRAAILTGQDIYRLQEGGVLTGILREEYKVFPLLLEGAGYIIGNAGKDYWPRKRKADGSDLDGAHTRPIGERYNNHPLEDAPLGAVKRDYPADFSDFLNNVSDNQPFFFWMGIGEPHIPHPTNLGAERIDLSKIRVPAYYPDTLEVRSAIADYLMEIEWADLMFGRMLDALEQRGLLENTLIVFTSDNGMPFPRAKATLYDAGVRMPLIMRWGDEIKAGQSISNPVSLIDMAPTFLDIAGVETPEEMTGKSLASLILDSRGVDPELQTREFVVSAVEKHVGAARADKTGYPRRALHTAQWSYIWNLEPDRWPAGDPGVFVPNWDHYGDVDPSPLKKHIMDNRNDPEIEPFFELNFGKTPEVELYDKSTDFDMVHNLANDAGYQNIAAGLRKELLAYLEETEDPRMRGEAPWDDIDFDE